MLANSGLANSGLANSGLANSGLSNSDGIYQASDHGLTITAHALPGETRGTYIGLAGEIDMAASVALSKTIDWLTARAPDSVLVDLAELTFAGSTLPNFIVRIRRAVPAGAELILLRARPATRWILRFSEMANIATLRDEPAATSESVKG